MKNEYGRGSLEQDFSTSVTPLQRLWSVSADKAIAQGNSLSPALSWPLVAYFGERDHAFRRIVITDSE